MIINIKVIPEYVRERLPLLICANDILTNYSEFMEKTT